MKLAIAAICSMVSYAIGVLTAKDTEQRINAAARAVAGFMAVLVLPM